MPFIDPFDNDQYMCKWMVLPLAPDDVLASFLDPYIITRIIRGEDQCTVFWYSGDYELSEFRQRADEWEAERRWNRSRPNGKEST